MVEIVVLRMRMRLLVCWPSCLMMLRDCLYRFMEKLDGLLTQASPRVSRSMFLSVNVCCCDCFALVIHIVSVPVGADVPGAAALVPAAAAAAKPMNGFAEVTNLDS